MGLYSNFHFYQLILDKKNSNKSNLDLYAGLSIGGAFGLFKVRDNEVVPSIGVFGNFYFGPHVGVKYYPKAGKVGVFSELGYGMTIFNAGITIRK